MAQAAPGSSITVYCGGSRAGTCTWVVLPHDAPSAPPVHTVLRGSTLGEVFLADDGSMHAEWVSGRLVGEIPGLGPVRMQYQPNRPSTVEIASLQPGADPFFPARAVQSLFYTVELLDEQGQPVETFVNLDPMVMEAEIEAIPPNGVSFSMPDAVTFFDLSGEEPRPALILSEESTGSVDEPGGLELSLQEQHVDTDLGTYSLVLSLDGDPESAQDVEWFVTPLRSAAVFSATREARLSLLGAETIEVSGTFDPSADRPGLVAHAFARGDVEAEARLPISFAEPS